MPAIIGSSSEGCHWAPTPGTPSSPQLPFRCDLAGEEIDSGVRWTNREK